MAFHRHCTLLATLVVVLAARLSDSSVQGTGLEVGFYKGTPCSNVEDVVRAEVKKEFKRNPSIVALLLRMFFHDCFANSKCDASLLIKKNIGPLSALPTELDAGANEGIRGLAFIDNLKQTVVEACVGKEDVVSCADIIALATRDAVSLAANRAPFDIPTGRRDAKESLMANGDTLPSPGFPIPLIVSLFKSRGFSPEETVILSGAHTVGEARCKFFSDRLYNFQGSGEADPDMNPATVEALKKVCPPANGENRAFLDQGPGSAFVVDKSYYVMLTQHSGVLQSDQSLLNDTLTKDFAQTLADGSDDDFFAKFEKALIKMGCLGASINLEGDIRKVCSVLNPLIG